MDTGPRTAVAGAELPVDNDSYAHGGLASTLAFLATSGCWEDTVDLDAASLAVIAKAMGAAYDGLDKETIKRNICSSFRAEHAPCGEDLDALNPARAYDFAGYKTDQSRLKRLKGKALQRAYIGLVMWAPPVRAIQVGIDSGAWGAINEASITAVLNLDDTDLYVRTLEYLMECFEVRRPQERVRVEDGDAPNAANMSLAAALAKGIHDARANSAGELDKLFVDTPELAEQIAMDPFAAGADAVLHKYGMGPDGKTIPTSELMADRAKCQVVVAAVMAAPPKYDSARMSTVEHAAATESYNRNKYHETLAKTAAAKISLIDALVGHSGAELAVSREDEGPRRVALVECVARAAAEVARARAYAADVELYIICDDVAVLRDKLVTDAMRDSSTLKRGQLKARRTVLHRELRKRVMDWRRVRARARASRVLRAPRALPALLLALYRIVLPSSERARSVSPSVGRARVRESTVSFLSAQLSLVPLTCSPS
jgi:hypothetical protein